jgi:NAD(P)-dependent dehydrogenase (short-subunit alcohol dehydrogenase family)
MRVVVTGANRGIGLEFARQYAARGDEVEAGARDPGRATGLHALAAQHPGRVRVHALDVTDDASVRGFATALGDRGVDVLINNAGVMGRMLGIDDLDFDDLLHTYAVNAVGPLRVTQALLPHLRRGTGKRIAHLTSGMASIGDNTSGGAYAYRMSKVALNMASRCLAIELRDEGIVSAVFNPGWVRTDMGGPGAPTAVEDSVARLVARIDALTLADSGKFLDHRGREWPW